MDSPRTSIGLLFLALLEFWEVDSVSKFLDFFRSLCKHGITAKDNGGEGRAEIILLPILRDDNVVKWSIAFAESS